MEVFYRYIIYLNLLCAFIVSGQETIPDPPVFYKVSVDIVTGYDSIIWHHVDDVDYYRINKVVYDNPLNPPWVDSIGYVDAPDTIFVAQETDSGEKPVGYSVHAVRRTSGSTLRSNHNIPDSTIHLEIDFDSCSRQISLTWNDYNTWRGNIKEYRIYKRVNNNNFEVIATFENPVNHFSEYNVSVETETNDLSFYIEAIRNDMRISHSNRKDVLLSFMKPPEYIIANYSKVSENGKIEITFTTDSASQLNDYRILRANSIDGIYTEISRFRSNDKVIHYIDDEINYSSGIFYYKLLVLDNCGIEMRESNAMNNIVLTGENSGVNNILSWNEIEDWIGETGEYIIYRQNSDQPSLIDSFVVTVGTTFKDNLQGYFSSVTTQNGEFCYYLKAVETNNPYGNNKSLSNSLCLKVNPDVVMPNAFIPNNNEGENNVFRPLFIFEPQEYELTIYNRWGNKVWSGKSPWDGRQNDNLVPEGVYVYFISVKFQDGTSVEKTGHVTVIYR